MSEEELLEYKVKAAIEIRDICTQRKGVYRAYVGINSLRDKDLKDFAYMCINSSIKETILKFGDARDQFLISLYLGQITFYLDRDGIGSSGSLFWLSVRPENLKELSLIWRRAIIEKYNIGQEVKQIEDKQIGELIELVQTEEIDEELLEYLSSLE